MKFLVATKETQGQRPNDFSWTEENEPLIFGTECSHEEIDGPCGCMRSMVGATTSKATTTMKVAEVQPEIIGKISEHYKENWRKDPISAMGLAIEMLFEVHEIATHFEIGQVLERRGGSFYVRENGGEEGNFTIHLLSPYATWEGIKAKSGQDALTKVDFPPEIDLNCGPFHWVVYSSSER